jgi:hypothetical protein
MQHTRVFRNQEALRHFVGQNDVERALLLRLSTLEYGLSSVFNDGIEVMVWVV